MTMAEKLLFFYLFLTSVLQFKTKSVNEQRCYVLKNSFTHCFLTVLHFGHYFLKCSYVLYLSVEMNYLCCHWNWVTCHEGIPHWGRGESCMVKEVRNL